MYISLTLFSCFKKWFYSFLKEKRGGSSTRAGCCCCCCSLKQRLWSCCTLLSVWITAVFARLHISLQFCPIFLRSFFILFSISMLVKKAVFIIFGDFHSMWLFVFCSLGPCLNDELCQRQLF